MSTCAWTKPYFGVQHLGEMSTGGKWATVEDYGKFAICVLWFPGCAFHPTQTRHDSADEARKKAEKWMANP